MQNDDMLEDELAYEGAKCRGHHSDGTTCMPEWDGAQYICTYRVHMYAEMTSA